jgi:ribonuclease HI
MITAYVDGACRGGNPGFTSCAWVLYDSQAKDADYELFQAQYLGPERHTNNFSEYHALILLLEYLYIHNYRNVIIHSDSELVVNQTLGKWVINQEELRSYATKCYGLIVRGCHVLKHIKGHDGNKGNERADALCNEILDAHKEEYEKVSA